MTLRIALVEDDDDQATLVSHWLASAEHACLAYGSGERFLRDFHRESFDLVILDWMLPDTDGLRLLLAVREHCDWPIPVLFVTRRNDEEDVVRALEAGADDYLAKPVRRGELLARVQALARRADTDGKGDEPLDLGNFHIDLRARCLCRSGEPLSLTQKEFDLACFLFRNAGRVVSRGHLLESVWGQRPDLNTRTVDTHVSRLRQKLALKPENGWQLQAVYQHGYRLEQVRRQGHAR